MPPLRGWGEIENYAKLNREKIKEYIDTQSFPLMWDGRDPYSTTDAIDEWHNNRLVLNHVKPT